MQCNESEILTVADLAALFSCDTETVATRLIAGDLPGVKVGRGWIIPKQALFERLNQKAHEEAAARREALKTAQTPSSSSRASSIATIYQSSAASAMLPSSMPLRSGRKRRQPPALPNLSSQESC
ncbi:helix-turn-helix domain-containing protein [Delftia sp. WSY_9]|uniref:helix-turn-helix domain-containing protein n=1 Tax=unclassified Delftia TaxID=2613839 RepID=UPI003709FB3E